MTASEQLSQVDPISLENYRGCAGFMADMAYKNFDLAITPETYDKWEGVMVVMRVVDTALDTGGLEERTNTIDYLVNTFSPDGGPEKATAVEAMNPLLGETVSELRSLLTDEEAAKYLRKYLQLIKNGEEQGRAATANDYIFRTKLTGQLAVGLVDAVSGPFEKQQPRYKEFMRCFRLAIRAGSILDAAFDLERDKNEGTISIEPTRRNQARLLASATPEIAKSIGYLGVGVLKFVPSTVATFGGRGKRKLPPTETAEAGQAIAAAYTNS